MDPSSPDIKRDKNLAIYGAQAAPNLCRPRAALIAAQPHREEEDAVADEEDVDEDDITRTKDAIRELREGLEEFSLIRKLPLVENLEEARETGLLATLEAQRDELAAAKKQIESLQAELATARTQVESAVTAPEVISLKADLKASEQNVTSLKADLKASAEKAVSLEKELESARASLDVANKQVSDADQMSTKFSSELHAAKKQVRGLRHALDASKRERERQKRTIRRLKQGEAMLTRKFTTARAKKREEVNKLKADLAIAREREELQLQVSRANKLLLNSVVHDLARGAKLLHVDLDKVYADSLDGSNIRQLAVRAKDNYEGPIERFFEQFGLKLGTWPPHGDVEQWLGDKFSHLFDDIKEVWSGERQKVLQGRRSLQNAIAERNGMVEALIDFRAETQAELESKDAVIRKLLE